MVLLGVREKISKLMLNEVLGMCTDVCVGAFGYYQKM